LGEATYCSFGKERLNFLKSAILKIQKWGWGF